MRRQELNRLIAILIGAAITLADVLTKRWAGLSFTDRTVEVIPGLLWLEYTENPGAAFSLFRGAGPFLGVAAVVAVGIVMRALEKSRSRWEVVAFGFILGGALGNLFDRIFRGEGFLDGRVIDWIRLPNWPTFNLADSAITVGVALLVGRSLLARG